MDYQVASHAECAQRLDLQERPTRMLHVMLRVRDLERSLDFYIGALGMQLLRRQDYPGSRFTLVMLGYGEEEGSTVLELTHVWDRTEPYELGTAYGHIALEVEDIYLACAELAERGVPITRAPGPMKYSTRLIAFLRDPDGYRIELMTPKQ